MRQFSFTHPKHTFAHHALFFSFLTVPRHLFLSFFIVLSLSRPHFLFSPFLSPVTSTSHDVLSSIVFLSSSHSVPTVLASTLVPSETCAHWSRLVLENNQQPLPHPRRRFFLSEILDTQMPLNCAAKVAFRNLLPHFEGLGTRTASLLYRAARSQFSLAACRKALEDQAPTLVLVHRGDSIVGGATERKWLVPACPPGSLARSQGVADPALRGKSFIFALQGPGKNVPVGVAFTCHGSANTFALCQPPRGFGSAGAFGSGKSCLQFGEDLKVEVSDGHLSLRSQLGANYGKAQGLEKGNLQLCNSGNVDMIEFWALS